MGDDDRNERRFLALREVLRLYAAVDGREPELPASRSRAADEEADGVARIARAVLGELNARLVASAAGIAVRPEPEELRSPGVASIIWKPAE